MKREKTNEKLFKRNFFLFATNLISKLFDFYNFKVHSVYLNTSTLNSFFDFI